MTKPLETILPFIVECKSTQAFFETIAGFNRRSAADGYAAACAAARPSFQYRVSNPCPEIDNASVVERRIVGKVVRDLIAAGYVISVNDGGEEDVLVGVTDETLIFKALASTDADTLRVSKKGSHPGTPRGTSFVYLVWGNDCSVISDYGMSLEEIMRPALALSNELEG